MPKHNGSSKKVKSRKNIKLKSNVPDTSRAKKACPMPMTINYIDVEGGVKKDKEVKEKDVFDFSYKPKVVYDKK